MLAGRPPADSRTGEPLNTQTDSTSMHDEVRDVDLQTQGVDLDGQDVALDDDLDDDDKED